MNATASVNVSFYTKCGHGPKKRKETSGTLIHVRVTNFLMLICALLLYNDPHKEMKNYKYMIIRAPHLIPI